MLDFMNDDQLDHALLQSNTFAPYNPISISRVNAMLTNVWYNSYQVTNTW